MKGKTLLIGNYPPPFSGQSIAFKILKDEFDKKNINYIFLNTVEKNNRRQVCFRLYDYFFILINFIRILIFNKINTVYHIVSSNRLGFLRDFIIIGVSTLFGKRIIIHSHNGNYNLFYDSSNIFLKFCIRIIINSADKIILLSHKLRKTFYFILKEERFVYIPNGLPDPVNCYEIKKKYNIISVLYLSNLIESKGYLDILKAMILLKKEGSIKNYRFHFAGSFMLNPSQDISYSKIKDAESLFFNIVKTNQLENYIEFHGVVQGVIKQNLLNEAHVFLLPTYYNIEAQPITIIEAMAHGCAIFSTDFRGISEMLINEYNGEFVAPKNPISLARKLKSIDTKQLLKYSYNSMELYKNKFTKEQHLEKILKILIE